jgi:DNA helicase-2/ATP-dependent DNA helicase PcrA
MFDFKKHLNPSQFEAVNTIDGALLVIAGAGSGKTRVIEYRVLYLVQNKVSPRSILLLTFTRKAAREMLSRAAVHDPRCKNVEGGTFHSFGLKVLKRYAMFVGIPRDFIILDEADAEEAIHRCCTKLGFLEKRERFPKKDTLRKIFSFSINKDASIGEILLREYPHFLEYTPKIETLMEKYKEYKRASGYVDYDDLLVHLKSLLEDERVRRELSRRYRFVMVDEYQDTNRLQADITYLLSREHGNVMVVGDDAQSIYGFRGTSHRNIMEFPQKFPGCKIIKLQENYRSTQTILDVANAVLENMKEKYSKCLSSARRKRGSKPGVFFFKDPYEEASWIADKVKQLWQKGILFNRQGVLFRSSHISIPLQTELSKRNIPYQIFGGLRFYETAHVKDLMAHIKILANPRDELAWNRILLLVESIGHKTAERILEKISICHSLEEIFLKIFGMYKKDKAPEGLRRLRVALESARKGGMSVGERFQVLLEYYKPILMDRFDDWHIRLNDLIIVGQIASRYYLLEEFLIDFAIEPPERGVLMVNPSIPDDEKPLTLSTIHSAKGLEWDTVFIMGLVDGLLPVSYALSSEEETEEEHRLFYVAITRAKNRLFLTLHHEGTGQGIYQFNKISRFLDAANVMAKLDLSSKEAFYPKR